MSNSNSTEVTASTTASNATAQWIAAGTAVGVAVGVFSTYFPYVTDPTFGKIAPILYQQASYHYDERSLFDNTILTYGTDYFLAFLMTVWAWKIGSHPKKNNKAVNNSTITTLDFLRNHSFRSKGLLYSYALSVFTGALAHHFFTTVDHRNTLAFRFLWTLCVGSVAAAAGFMGSIATVWAEYDQHQNCPSAPIVPASFWAAFCAVGTLAVALGTWSYQRPAADIFVAGITQTPSSFYCMLLLWNGLPTLRGWSALARAASALTFVLNAPLLPLYPYLVSTTLSLGQINVILHSCLLLAWSSQGLVLLQVARSLEREMTPPPHAVPVKPKTKAL